MKDRNLKVVEVGTPATSQKALTKKRLELQQTELRLGDHDRLWLPRDQSVDLHLLQVPQLVPSADALFSKAPRRLTTETAEKLIYVQQGEVAHAHAGQCDVLVSDKATTCHILALRSTSESTALASLAHVDAPSYDACVRAMLQTHCEYHSDDTVSMEIHILGGFCDRRGSSRAITDWLIRLLADLATEYNLTLNTCAVTSRNDNGRTAPRGRGLGVNVKTGQVFLAQVDAAVAGPLRSLRAARIWAPTEPVLTVVHDWRREELWVSPFLYFPTRRAQHLLSLSSDKRLLQQASTSPDVEEDDFCESVRQTLTLLMDVPYSNFFGLDCATPVVCRRRTDHVNLWEIGSSSRRGKRCREQQLELGGPHGVKRSELEHP